MSDSSSNSFIKFYSLKFKTICFALLSYSIVLICYRLPVFQNLDTHLLGGTVQDPGLYYWLFNIHRKISLFSWFEAPNYYPYSETLAWSDNFILPSLLGSSLGLFGLSIPAQYNLTLLFALLLNALTTFFLVYKISGKYWSSFMAGLLLLISSFINDNLGHPQLIFIFWFPATLYLQLKFYDSLSPLWLFLTGLVITLTFLSTVYYALFICILVACSGLIFTLLHPARVKTSSLPIHFGALFAGLLPLTPFLLPYLNTQNLFGKRELFESYFFSATGLSFISASPTNYLYGQILNFNFSDFSFWFGFGLLTLLILAITRLHEVNKEKIHILISISFFILTLIFGSFTDTSFKFIACLFVWLSIASFLYFCKKLGDAERQLGSKIFTNRNFICLFVGLGIFFSAFSLGPIINPLRNDFSFSPFRLIYEFLPGMASMRAVERFNIVTYLLAVLLLPFCLPYFFKSNQRQYLFQCVLLIVLVAEQFCNLYPLEELPKFHFPISELEKYGHENSAVLVLPLQDYSASSNVQLEPYSYAKENVNAMLWSMNSSYRLVNGYSGQTPKLHQEMVKSFSNFPSEKGIRILRTVPSLKFIKFYGSKMPNFSAVQFEELLRKYPELTILSKDLENTYILKYTPNNRIEYSQTLYVPSGQGGLLSLELKINSLEVQSCSLDIYINNQKQLKSLNIVGQTFKNYQLTVASKTNLQKPYQYKLIPNCNAEIWLGERRYDSLID